jgi:hypothetical protein
VAQEVEEAAKKIGYDFSGVDKPQMSTLLMACAIPNLLCPCESRAGAFTRNQDLKKRIEKLEAIMNVPQSKFNVPSATLAQNVPNPSPVQQLFITRYRKSFHQPKS